jgi:hypothetical protein
MQARGDLVMAMLQYENFKAEYQDVFLELNRKES